MGIEQKMNKWIIGAVMGKKHVKEHESSHERKKTETNSSSWLKWFIQQWVGELKKDISEKKNLKDSKGKKDSFFKW